jgi:DNA-directed RNA polymerase subunit N (RpoN/RPB10)
MTVSLYPVVQNVQVQVEYPRRISRDDRGVQHHKRLVVSITKTEAGPAELISLAVKPVSGAIRFLAESGGDRSGQLTITATHGITEVHTLYIEHPNVPPGGPISLSLQILPPTGVITQPVPVEKSDFAIEEESFIAGAIRGVVSFMPWETFLLAFLAIPGAFLKTLWDRRESMADLYAKMKQAWEEWKIDDIRSLYSEYQGMVLFYIPFFWSTVLSIPGHRGIELLHRQAEARFHFKQAHFHNEQAIEWLSRGAETSFLLEQAEAEEHLARALEWDPIYEKVQVLDEKTRKLEEQYRETRDPRVWWFEPMPDLEIRQKLIKLLEDRKRTQAEVRRRIVNTLGHIGALEARRVVEKTLWEDDDLSVKAQAAWALARRPRAEKVEERWPRVAQSGTVKEWLQAFPSPLEYNPFQATTAEGDRFLDRHFFDHPVYHQLLDYGSQSVAIFADQGGGKTCCRRMFKSSLTSPPNLVVEYTNFSALVREGRKISVEDHIRSILEQASALLSMKLASLSLPAGVWQEQVKQFLENIQKRGYTAVHVLVDNVDGYAETQASLRIAELLIRHLVGSFDLLDTADLCFRFFLPLSLKERLLRYGGFTTGRVRIVDMEWTEDLLLEVVQTRLKTASSPRSQVDSLMAFTSEQIDLDRLVASQAQGSPRRLILLVNRLFQHRAQIWYESARSPEELFIRITDWAILLEHLIKQRGVTG